MSLWPDAAWASAGRSRADRYAVMPSPRQYTCIW